MRNDARFNALGLNPSDYRTVGEVAQILAEHPELMQRPVIDDGRVVIVARPPKRVEEWLANRDANPEA